jgi:hypothetical protein
MRKPETEIVTFLSYENVFSTIEKKGIILPVTYLKDIKKLDEIIKSIIKEFEPTQAIAYSAFLNAVVQTYHAKEVQSLGINEAIKTGLTDKKIDGILFHRDNLLRFIIELINLKETCGKKEITGFKNTKNSQDYYKSLLLISSKIIESKDHPRHTLLIEMLRTYPYYYLPEITYSIYSIRIQRYWYIYNHILFFLDDSSKDLIGNCIRAIENFKGISLKEYFYVINTLFNWFVHIPFRRKENPDFQKIKELGFKKENPLSFYISKKEFLEDNSLIRLIDDLSLDINDFKKLFDNSRRKDKTDAFYRNFQDIFDHPIFKVDHDTFCILDLKFLFEGICSGFLWHLTKKSSAGLQDFKAQYGRLMDEYFSFIIKKIFPNVRCTNKIEGEPDAILESEEVIIIFEFTVEYYRLASLYKADNRFFIEDLSRILFNDNSGQQTDRIKNDKGKFFKLNRYISNYKNKNKRIIPVLITENNLGDYDLLNQFDKILSENTINKQLSNIQTSIPLIMNLDDLEIFWAFSDQANPVNDFIRYIDEWEKAEKGIYHYNFASFVSFQNNNLVKNEQYIKFFNYPKFINKIKTSLN